MNWMQNILQHKTVKGILILLGIVVSIFYVQYLLDKGFWYEDAFLKQVETADGKRYSGRNLYGKLVVSVEGRRDESKTVDVTFDLPNDVPKTFTVEFKEKEDWDAGVQSVKDGDGKIIFEGEYRKDVDWLYDKEGQPIIDFRMVVVGEKAEYYISPLRVIRCATGDRMVIRGKEKYFIPAIVLLGILLIDMKWPTFFFYLDHLWDVKDPEPSDLYIDLQHLLWKLMPIVIVVLLVLAII